MKKKIGKILQTSSLFFLLSLMISCNNLMDIDKKNEKDFGSATVNMFVPNYKLISENNNSARVIAPQTDSIKFSYYDEGEWISLDSVSLSKATSTPIENAESGIFGNIYKVTFSGIYVGTYEVGSMKVELLDSEGNTITSGTNKIEVTVSKDSSASAEFYTIPESYNDTAASLSVGEMKFFLLSLPETDKKYGLKLSVAEGETVPDIVLFNSDGTYKEYKTGAEIELGKVPEACSYYVGVYAKESACTYKTTLIYYPEDIILDDSVVEIDYEDTYQISYTVEPYGATVKNVTYTSDNEKVSVSATGLVTASSSEDGVQTAIITLNVDGIEKNLTVKVHKAVTSITLCDDIFIASTNGTCSVHAKVLPEDATDQTVTWSVSDENIATCENGTITGVAGGLVTLTAKAGNKTATAKIVVLNAETPFTVTNKEDLKELTSDDSSKYAGYITDSAGKIAYKYTTKGHARETGLSSGVGKWDIIGNKSGTWYSSTYVDAGWGWKINDTTVSLSEDGIAKSGNLQLQVKPVLVYNKGVPFVLFVQLLTNTGSEDLTAQKFGSGTDVQIAGNDEAPVNATEFGGNLIDSSTNMIFSLNCISGDGITPVSTMWIGKYDDSAMRNVYTDNRVSCINVDSAMAYSWQDIDIKAGETKVYAVRLTFVEDEGGTLHGVIY